MKAIEAKGLTKRYKDTVALDGLDLVVYEGELFALLGVNGAGKTTAIRLLSTLAKPTTGEAYVLGKSVITQTNEVKKLIALSPQETAIAPLLSAKENLELVLSLNDIKGEKAAAKMKELGRIIDFDKIGKKRAGKLSGGWQRRLSLAMALACEPKVLFLDEPTLGLDVIARSELWNVIRSLKGKVTIILTTHYLDEAEALSDRVGIMKNGKLLTVGTSEEIKRKTGRERFEDAFISIVTEEGV